MTQEKKPCAGCGKKVPWNSVASDHKKDCPLVKEWGWRR